MSGGVAGMSAPVVTPSAAPTCPQDEVEHFYWLDAGRVALELGVEVQSICGEAWFFLEDQGEAGGGGGHELVADTGPLRDDCPRCLRLATLPGGVR